MKKSLFATILLLIQAGTSMLQTDCSLRMVTYLIEHGMR